MLSIVKWISGKTTAVLLRKKNDSDVTWKRMNMEEKQEKEKTEQVEKEEQIFPKKVPEESAPKL